MNVRVFQGLLSRLSNLSGLEVSYEVNFLVVGAYESGVRRSESVTLFCLNGHGERESIASGSMGRVAEVVVCVIRVLELMGESRPRGGLGESGVRG